MKEPAVENLLPQPVLFVYFLLNISLKSRWVRGAAAYIFHRSAMGKFLRTVPTHIAGSCVGLFPAKITLNKIEATILIVGHIMPTVQACLIS